MKTVLQTNFCNSTISNSLVNYVHHTTNVYKMYKPLSCFDYRSEQPFRRKLDTPNIVLELTSLNTSYLGLI